MSLTLTEIDTITDATLLDGVQGFTTLTIGGVSYLYAAASGADAIAIYRLGEDGVPVYVDSFTDTAATYLDAVYELTSYAANGRQYIVAGGLADTGLTVFEVGAGGGLTPIQNIADAPTAPFAGNYGQGETLSLGTSTFLYWPSQAEDGFTMFEVGADGTLSLQTVVLDDATRELDGLRTLTGFEAWGRQWLIGAGSADDGVTLFEVLSTGTPVVADTFTSADTDGVTDIAVARVEGNTYLFLASIAAGTLVTLTLTPEGDLVQRGVALSVPEAFDVSVTEIGGASYLAVSQYAAGQLQVYRVEADGVLNFRAAVADETGLALAGQGAHRIVEIGGVAYLYASGRADDGFSVFRLDMPVTVSLDGQVIATSETFEGALRDAPAGSVIALTNPGLYSNGGPEYLTLTTDDITLQGDGSFATFVTLDGAARFTGAGAHAFSVTGSSAAGEVIRTLAGADTLLGAGGDDTLSGGPGADLLDGGIGRDRLVGNAGSDTLWGGEGRDTVEGGGGQDRLDGGAGADWLQGGGQDDLLFGGIGTGADTLEGGSGDDYLIGGASTTLQSASGADLLEGGDGNDTLFGGAGGRDTLRGGEGNDNLFGGLIDALPQSGGQKLLIGDAGHDQIFGDGGGDTIRGGTGRDTLYGRDGDDLVLGGGWSDGAEGGRGDDTVHGGAGNDTVAGMEGADHVTGGAGDDLVLGGFGDGPSKLDGDDLLEGGGGQDTLNGGVGHDTVLGGSGGDLLKGERGRDLLVGGTGADTLWSGGGADVFRFRPGDGTDRVKDFRDDIDRLDLALGALGYADGAALVADVGRTSAQGHAVLDFGADRIVVENIDVGLLADDIF